jgi:hypothetical protein
LATVYPNFRWKEYTWAKPQKTSLAFKGQSSKTQYGLYNMVTQIFPKEHVYMNFRYQDLHYITGQQRIEYDVSK